MVKWRTVFAPGINTAILAQAIVAQPTLVQAILAPVILAQAFFAHSELGNQVVHCLWPRLKKQRMNIVVAPTPAET